MKKIISVLSVLALMSTTAVTAYADSRITPDSADQSGSMNVSYNAAPGYIVTIPSGVDLKDGKTAEIKLTGMTASEKPLLEKNQTISVSLSNAQNGFSGSDGKTLLLKAGSTSLGYSLTGVNGKAGQDDVVAKFRYDPDKTLDDYKQTLTFELTSTVKYAGIYTDNLTFEVFLGNRVDISKLTGVYQAQDGDVLTGKGNADTHITVADGATVTLKNCDITDITNNSSHKWAGITLEGDGTIILAGTNKVKGGYENNPGVYVPENKTLTIDGAGSLEASSNGAGAGIGGGYRISCGNIIINGGTVTANGRNYAAGIGGSGNQSSCGNITINGGIVTANGGLDGAGIGSGFDNNSCGNITINGGTVTANGGNYAAGIGSGYSDSSCGNITINGGTVTATGGYAAAGIGSGYYNSFCTSITIKNTVNKVEAAKGKNAPNSIGAGNLSTCGTVTIETGANVIQK